MCTFSAKQVLVNQKFTSDVAVAVSGGLVTSTSKRTKTGASSGHDFGDVIMTPGFVDLQVNGCNGVIFNHQSDTDTLKKMEEGNLRHGVTSFLPTFITETDRNIIAALELVEHVMWSGKVASIKGMHLEGPYLSTGHSGAHPSSLIRPLDADMLKILCEFGEKGVLRLITVAPENVSPKQIGALKESSIVVSLGHSSGTAEEVMMAVEAGATLVTHLFNGMPPLQGRMPSLVGQAFASQNLAATIIPDFVHVHPTSIEAARSAMGRRLFAVTDATATSDGELTDFDFGHGRCTLRDGIICCENGSLAGSALTMDVACANLAQLFTLENALGMCSKYPAQAAGIDAGSLAPGSPADFILIDFDNENKLSIKATYLKGEPVYSRQ